MTVPAQRNTGDQMSPQTVCPIANGSAGIWNNSGTLKFRLANGSDLSLIGGTPAAAGDIPYSTSGGVGMSFIADIASGSYLRSGGVGAPPLWSTMTLPNSCAAGDLLIGSSANAVGNLADVATGSVLASGGVGVAPAWSATPTLTSLTAGSLVIAAGTGSQTGNTSVTIFSNTTPVTSLTSGTIDGQSYTMPANTLSANGQQLVVHSFFLHAANTNSTTFALAFAGTVFSAVTSAGSNDPAYSEFRIIRLTSSTAQVAHTAVSASGFTHQGGVVTGLNFGSSIIVKNQITGAVTNSDLVAQAMRVTWQSN